MDHTRIRIFQDLEPLSQAAAEAFISLANSSIEQSGEFSVVLTGGSTVVRLYEILSTQPHTSNVEWDKVRFFWGDERLVPSDHSESNYGQARKLLLDHVGLNARNIFRMQGELEPHEAVADYKQKLQKNAAEGLNWPRFDLVLLGVGSDGHIASIFPGEISEVERTLPVMTTTSEYQDRPAGRVSLSPLVFNSAKNIFFLVAGESKATILARLFDDQEDPEDLPVLRIHPQDGEVTWYVDQAAASRLPKELQDQGVD